MLVNKCMDNMNNDFFCSTAKRKKFSVEEISGTNFQIIYQFAQALLVNKSINNWTTKYSFQMNIICYNKPKAKYSFQQL